MGTARELALLALADRDAIREYFNLRQHAIALDRQILEMQFVFLRNGMTGVFLQFHDHFGIAHVFPGLFVGVEEFEID